MLYKAKYQIFSLATVQFAYVGSLRTRENSSAYAKSDNFRLTRSRVFSYVAEDKESEKAKDFNPLNAYPDVHLDKGT